MEGFASWLLLGGLVINRMSYTLQWYFISESTMKGILRTVSPGTLSLRSVLIDLSFRNSIQTQVNEGPGSLKSPCSIKVLSVVGRFHCPLFRPQGTMQRTSTFGRNPHSTCLPSYTDEPGSILPSCICICTHAPDTYAYHIYIADVHICIYIYIWIAYIYIYRHTYFMYI